MDRNLAACLKEAPPPFGDAEYNGKRKRTRRQVFLSEMDQAVPW